MSPAQIKEIMQKYGIAPKKLFGQNFMISEGILDKIVASAGLSKNDIVLEIGPGLGALTFKLAPFVKQIIAVEKDRNLVKILRDRILSCHSEHESTEGEESQRSFANAQDDTRVTQDDHCFKNVEIIESDILKFDPKNYNLKPRTYSLIANIPYYLTSALIRKFLESENKPQKMILMIQKEVAQRICPSKNVRRPTSHIKMNLLALSVQFYADAKILFYVSKNNFWPAPKVDSAVIEIAPRAPTQSRGADSELFFKIARAGFASKRKQLASNLSRLVIASKPLAASEAWRDRRERGNLKSSKEKMEKVLQKIGLNPKTRAEDLKLEDWIALAKENVI